MNPVELLNAWGASWFGFMTRALIDASVLLALILVVWLPMRRRVSAQLAHGLFCLVLLKLIVPVPVGWSWWQSLTSSRPAEPARHDRASRRRHPRRVVLPTTGDVGASLADASAPEPVAIAEPAAGTGRGVMAGASAVSVARPALTVQAWLMLGWASMRHPAAGAVPSSDEDHAPIDARGGAASSGMAADRRPGPAACPGAPHPRALGRQPPAQLARRRGPGAGRRDHPSRPQRQPDPQAVDLGPAPRAGPRPPRRSLGGRGPASRASGLLLPSGGPPGQLDHRRAAGIRLRRRGPGRVQDLAAGLRRGVPGDRRAVRRAGPGGRAGARTVRIAIADPPPPDPHPRQSPHGPRAALAGCSLRSARFWPWSCCPSAGLGTSRRPRRATFVHWGAGPSRHGSR